MVERAQFLLLCCAAPCPVLDQAVAIERCMHRADRRRVYVRIEPCESLFDFWSSPARPALLQPYEQRLDLDRELVGASARDGRGNRNGRRSHAATAGLLPAPEECDDIVTQTAARALDFLGIKVNGLARGLARTDEGQIKAEWER